MNAGGRTIWSAIVFPILSFEYIWARLAVRCNSHRMVFEYSNAIRIFECNNRSINLTVVDLKLASVQLRALAHPTRLAILEELSQGPKCVTDLEDLLPVRQANLSQHLALLRHTQLVDFAQDGQTRCYYLARPKLVGDLLSLVGRSEPVVTRTADEIAAYEAKTRAMKPAKLQKRESSLTRKVTSN